LASDAAVAGAAGAAGVGAVCANETLLKTKPLAIRIIVTALVRDMTFSVGFGVPQRGARKLHELRRKDAKNTSGYTWKRGGPSGGGERMDSDNWSGFRATGERSTPNGHVIGGGVDAIAQ
jgi:hypothetical protein